VKGYDETTVFSDFFDIFNWKKFNDDKSIKKKYAELAFRDWKESNQKNQVFEKND
jgi:hypothetical protein